MRPGDTIKGVTKPANTVFVHGMEQRVQRSIAGVRADVMLCLRVGAGENFMDVSQSMSSASTEPTGAQILTAFSTLETQLLTAIQTRLDAP